MTLTRLSKSNLTTEVFCRIRRVTNFQTQREHPRLYTPFSKGNVVSVEKGHWPTATHGVIGE